MHVPFSPLHSVAKRCAQREKDIASNIVITSFFSHFLFFCSLCVHTGYLYIYESKEN